MKILFKYATRSRPDLFDRGMRSIIDNCNSNNYVILVSVDGDDTSMRKEFFNTKEYPNTIVKVGTSENKIDAINRDMDMVSDWDILVNMSDDMVFTLKGFDNEIRESFEDLHDYSINLAQCLHFPDGNRSDLITMAIMGREYYNRFGYIYHPDYKSLWCDNEMTDVAKMLGCYKYVDKHIVRHLHPAYGKGKYDKQYRTTESFNGVDKHTYYNRKAKNFDL